MEYWCNGTDSGTPMYLTKSVIHVTYQFLVSKHYFFLRKRVNTNLSFTVRCYCYTGQIRTKIVRSATKFHRYLFSKFDDETRGKIPPHCVFIYVLRALNLQYMSNLKVVEVQENTEAPVLILFRGFKKTINHNKCRQVLTSYCITSHCHQLQG